MSNTLDTSHLDIDTFPWASSDVPGINARYKVIRCSIQNNSYTLWSEFLGPGFYGRHSHGGGVHAYTFSGSWHYLEYDWIAKAGSYVYEQPLSAHTLEILEASVVMFVIEGTIIDLDADGGMLGYRDAATQLKEYQADLERQGLELPRELITS